MSHSWFGFEPQVCSSSSSSRVFSDLFDRVPRYKLKGTSLYCLKEGQGCARRYRSQSNSTPRRKPARGLRKTWRCQTTSHPPYLSTIQGHFACTASLLPVLPESNTLFVSCDLPLVRGVNQLNRATFTRLHISSVQPVSPQRDEDTHRYQDEDVSCFGPKMT